MSTMLQIRNVPDDLHRKLKARAAIEGVSMSEFALREIKRAIDRPSRADVLERIAELPEVYLPESAAAVLRGERESR